uniref:Uncharacterized protein n=1 Tax=Leptobrachium leishanense TaxID=445787 RepID=A0A8C5QVR9_9ANUR
MEENMGNLQAKSSFSKMNSSHNAQDCVPLTENNNVPGIASSQPLDTMVLMQSYCPDVRDHLAWSIFNTTWMNFCCLGLLALVFSVKSRDRKLIGDKSAAISYGSTARSLNIAATVLSIITVLVVFAVL